MNKNPPVTYEHALLLRLAKKLGRIHMADMQILWLATALKRIASGNDANIELGIKRRKGQDDQKFNRHMKNQMAFRWIAAILNPPDGEPAPDKSEAIRQAAIAFDLDEDNLKRACPSEEELKAMVVFDWDSQRPKIN